MKLAGDFARVVAIQQPARFGGGAGMRHLRSLWIEYAKIRWHGDERAIVGLGRESVAQVRRECVFKVERAEAEEFVDRLLNARHAAVAVRDVSRPDPRADDQQWAAMRIDMIDAALRVVLGDKNGGVLPDCAV